jgi:hypothetical protein
MCDDPGGDRRSPTRPLMLQLAQTTRQVVRTAGGVYDVVVIGGARAAGGLAALLLAETGLRVPMVPLS